MSPNLPCFTTFPGPGEPLLLSAAQECLLRCSWSLVFPASCKGICQDRQAPLLPREPLCSLPLSFFFASSPSGLSSRLPYTHTPSPTLLFLSLQ